MDSLSDLSPSRYLTFTLPNPNPNPNPLHIAVLDSPLAPQPLSPPRTAALLVPPGRESDWTFSTLAGHVSLMLSSPEFSRLVLVGSVPSPLPKPYRKVKDANPINPNLEDSLMPVLLALCPKSAFEQSSLPQVPFLSFEDSVVCSVPKELIVGPIVGEMIIEDVCISNSNSNLDDCLEIRRRLRFKRMPNLIQTQVLLSPDSSSCSSDSDWLSVLNSESVRVRNGSLVQPYLAPMVAGLSLISPSLMEKCNVGIKPRCLCIGVGGGDLLMCLRSKLGFDAIGVEMDSVVIDVAKRHFGLVEDEFLKVCIGDGIRIVNEFALEFNGEGKLGLGFDAIMVDLDSGDVVSGVKAPPLEFLEKDFLLAVRSVLCENNGVLIINVIPPLDDGLFLKGIFDVFSGVFEELYRLDVEGNENFVLFATVSAVGTGGIKRKGPKRGFVEKLEEIVGDKLIRRIRRIVDDKDQK